MSHIKINLNGEFLAYVDPNRISAIKDALASPCRTNPEEPSGKSLIWVGNGEKFWEVDGTPKEIMGQIRAHAPVKSTRGVDNKPMMYEEIAQLERSLLNEIAAHDVTKRRLAAQEREIERQRSNLYKGRVENQIKEKTDETTDNDI